MIDRLFATYKHQDKMEPYVQALKARSWYPTREHDFAGFLLTDRDTPEPGSLIDKFAAGGKPSFIYPHSGYPFTVRWDGMYTRNPNITAVFAHSPAGVQVPQLYGFDRPIHEVGWSYCQLKAFFPRERIKSVLFAPIHPNFNGWLSDEDKKINRAAYVQLLHYRRLSNINLTVKYTGLLENAGIQRVQGVRYVRSAPNLEISLREIDQADLVVSHETFACLAIARGVPTLMMAVDVPPRLGHTPELYTHAKNFDKYKHLMMYPLDILNTSDFFGLIERAISTDDDIKEWKRLMIGTEFNPYKFVKIIEGYL